MLGRRLLAGLALTALVLAAAAQQPDGGGEEEGLQQQQDGGEQLPVQGQEPLDTAAAGAPGGGDYAEPDVDPPPEVPPEEAPPGDDPPADPVEGDGWGPPSAGRAVGGGGRGPVDAAALSRAAPHVTSVFDEFLVVYKPGTVGIAAVTKRLQRRVGARMAARARAAGATSRAAAQAANALEVRAVTTLEHDAGGRLLAGANALVRLVGTEQQRLAILLELQRMSNVEMVLPNAPLELMSRPDPMPTKRDPAAAAAAGEDAWSAAGGGATRRLSQDDTCGARSQKKCTDKTKPCCAIDATKGGK
jgi:hypothetical protein